ncbi:hypothetical protein MTO96_000914 [Rhipicephalus appendiculatus]
MCPSNAHPRILPSSTTGSADGPLVKRWLTKRHTQEGGKDGAFNLTVSLDLTLGPNFNATELIDSCEDCKNSSLVPPRSAEGDCTDAGVGTSFDRGVQRNSRRNISRCYPSGDHAFDKSLSATKGRCPTDCCVSIALLGPITTRAAACRAPLERTPTRKRPNPAFRALATRPRWKGGLDLSLSA